MTLSVVMVTLISIAIVGLIAHPLLGRTEEWDQAQAEGALTQLARKRDRVMRILKDLEIEHQTGMLSDDEFSRLRLDFKKRALGMMRELQRARLSRMRYASQGRSSTSQSMLRRIETMIETRKKEKETT